jgi:ubiquinone/menaquinone biosynthesis C-methylase UbiE
LINSITLPEKGMVLDIGCGTGYPAMELLEKSENTNVRIIAIDYSSPLLDIARKKAGGKSGRKVFFRTEDASDGLSFADEVYDITYSNLALPELGEMEFHLNEFKRVTSLGGQVAFTLPVHGTWREFFDIFRDVLTKKDKYDVLKSLEEYITQKLPETDTVVETMKKCGLKNIKVEKKSYELLFKSAREFFFAPVIEYGPLGEWKGIISDPGEMKELFMDIKKSIDTLFNGLIFSVSIEAACFMGTRPEEEEEIEEITLDEDDIEVIVDE